MKETRLDRIQKAIECCSAAVRCNQCPYKKYVDTYQMDECQMELMRDVCQEIGVDAAPWTTED